MVRDRTIRGSHLVLPSENSVSESASILLHSFGCLAEQSSIPSCKIDRNVRSIGQYFRDRWPKRVVQMRVPRHRRSGAAWLELLLFLALLTLLFQLFPSLGSKVVWALDLRNWTRGAAFVINLVVLFVLLGIRYFPSLLRQWRERRMQLVESRAKREKSRQLKEQREAIERMQESRRRRMY